MKYFCIYTNSHKDKNFEMTNRLSAFLAKKGIRCDVKVMGEDNSGKKETAADCILVLDDGKVADIGSHSELISRPGIYRDIYDIQMSSDDRRLIEEGGNG